MFSIAIKETKEFLRDKTNLFFFILFPVALVFLLGSLLGNMDKAEEAVGKIELQYVIRTDNPYQVMAIESFIKEVEDGQFIVFEKTKDLEAAKRLAGSNEIAAVVEFVGDPLTINIYEGTKHIQNRTVGALFHGFIQTNQTIMAVMKLAPESLNHMNGSNQVMIEQKNLGVNRTMIDYYAVSMVAMISFMSILVGAMAFLGERQGKTLNRLMITPQKRLNIFFQKVLGLVPQVIIQITIMMVISVLVFKANYAATMWNNLYLFFMFFIVTLCMISIGTVIGIVIKFNPMALIMPIIWLMMFFGGTYSKEVNVPGLTNRMPIFQIQQAAFDLAIFGHYEKVNTVIIVCIIVMVLALLFGAFLFSRKEEER